MSLVSVYVKSSSGIWYKNPLAYGRDWFLCYDDDEPPELVCVSTMGVDKIAMLIKTFGGALYKNRSYMKCDRLYPEHTNFIRSNCFFIKPIKNPYLEYCKLKFDEQYSELPQFFNGVIYGFDG